MQLSSIYQGQQLFLNLIHYTKKNPVQEMDSYINIYYLLKDYSTIK